ncbi:M14 family zinc carboxypeptidase [Ornithinicoccus hortensis]
MVGLLASGLPAAAVAAPASQGADQGTVRTLLPARPGGEQQGYPRQVQLPVQPEDPQDAAIKLGLTPYHAIAPKLNDLQLTSNRVSAEVIGSTVTGRQLYLVTLTAPETPAETAAQDRMREKILTKPAHAKNDRRLRQEYKTPVFLNNNIHGNEWEGTDAALRLIEEYATSSDPAVQQILEQNRIYLVVTANPDGRNGNTRANASGFDLNRDFLTATQPESIAVRDALVRTQPLLMLDLHGYVNGTLIEPTTPPHGENYEYDLFIKHAYPNGLGMESAINDLGYTPGEDGVRAPQIPFRDWAEGWDDWPPIFTPQYAAFHGAVSHTVEIPLRVNNADYGLPEEELQRRSAINTDVAHAAMTATIDYGMEHREELLADQIEIFRRGQAGEPQTPVSEDLFPEIGEEDVYLTDYPRGYVIPAGEDQRSSAAAARLVDHLIANGVEVHITRGKQTIDGTTYPAGSYVVDMHQSLRGMANTILGAGTDISDRVDAMYDISGWSPGLLWGADVVTVPEGATLRTQGRPITEAVPTGGVTGDADLVLPLDDPTDVAALNSLFDAGVSVEFLADGTVLVGEEDHEQAERVARDFGVTLTAAPDDAGGASLDRLTVAVAAGADERWALEEMGFDIVPVTPTVLNDGFDWGQVDTLYVSSGLTWEALDDDARTDLTRFLAGGGGFVGRDRAGANLNSAADLLEADLVRGRGDANGVVSVDSADSAVAGAATPDTFVYSPAWFTDLGEEVTVEQSYAEDGPLVSGRWRPAADGSGGPADAQGQPAVVSGVDESGAGVVLFGTQPMFRAHPKGQYPLVARALIWSTTQG